MSSNEILSPTAERIFEMKYAQTKEDGTKESWKEAVTRVASFVASAEENEATELAFMAQIFQVMYERAFIPGGRILANAGTNVKNLMNCFVLPIEDSRQGIYGTLKDAAEIFAWGGGIGYNFSHLREKGAEVGGTGGSASGPISFMSLFDQTGEVISQASRRGAQMGILDIDHPDVETFINIKNKLDGRNIRLLEEYQRNLKQAGLDIDGKDYFEIMRKTLADDQLTHFNISVAVTDEFMSRVNDGEKRATDLMLQIAENAWSNGDPGIFFIDRANQDNVTPYLGKIEATNPCGEVPLLSYEACCLGSINLHALTFPEGYIDLDYLRGIIRVAVRFLDNIQELSSTPIDKINESTKATRRIGLGVMGLADVLAEQGLEYDSDEAFEFCDSLAKFINTEAWRASMDLADERGAFPDYVEELINWELIDKVELDRRPMRNVAVTSVAPTGSISLIADVNSGIEPFFAHTYRRNITEGIGNTAKETFKQASSNTAIKTAHEIDWESHIAMQATWQKWTDSAVSKTINMPNDVSVTDVVNAYFTAWEQGLKGITVYRDGSKLFQILER